MTKKKKHHFVPRFYLRKFSLNAEGNKISLFNFPESKYVSCANLYDQAYKNYFYGEDLIIENALADLEKNASRIINNLLENTLPKYGSEEHYLLLVFVLFLRERTVYAADRINEITDKFIKSIAHEDSGAPPEIDKYTFFLTQPIKHALVNMASIIPLALDLKFKLIVNQSNESFITSDNPVVFYNQFFEPRKTPFSQIGVASKGLEIFLPLSPTHLLMFFDSDVYKVGAKNSMIIPVNDKKDIESLNLLQCINCNKNLYFNQDFTKSQICQLAKKSLRFRQQEKVEIKKFMQKISEKKKKILLMNHMCELKCSLALSFINFTKKAKKFSLGNEVLHLRDENRARYYQDLYDEFGTLVKKGRYRRSDFWEFVRRRYGLINACKLDL